MAQVHVSLSPSSLSSIEGEKRPAMDQLGPTPRRSTSLALGSARHDTARLGTTQLGSRSFCSFTRIHPCRHYWRPSNHQVFRTHGIFLAASRQRIVTSITSTSVQQDKKEEGEDDGKALQKGNCGLPRKRLAVFVSGGGSNFSRIHKATMDGKINGDISVVVSDKPDCKAIGYAKSNNIPVIAYPKSKEAENGVTPSELVVSLKEHEIDFILLAGYLKLVPVELVQAYPRAILNIHPALLPAFGGKGYYGRKVHEAVIKSGARYSGPTIHFVDEKYDNGKILAQRVVPVLPEDTVDDLAARVLKEEHRLYPEVVAALCDDRIFWSDNGVPIIKDNDEMEKYESLEKGLVSVYENP